MKKLFYVAAAAMMLAGCTKEELNPTVQAGRVKIDATIVTRATEVDFENGDKIGLSIKTADAETTSTNNCLTFNDSENLFMSDLEWYAGEATADLSAYYPYNAEGVPTTFAVKADQSVAENYTASDFMSASKTGVAPTKEAVGMTFRHRMTKLYIEVTNNAGSALKSLKVKNIYNTATVDVAAGTADVAADAGKVNITPNVVEAGKTYRAIVVPQHTALEVEVELENGNVLSLDRVLTTLKSGSQYNMTLTLESDKMYVSITGVIENWTVETTPIDADDDPVEFVENETSFVYDGVTYNFKTMKDGKTWMTQNLRYVPKGKTVSSDPKEDAGVWYSAANASKTADPDNVAEKGLLYDAATAFGVDAITAENAKSFEGTRGICPKGWHIPTAKEMTGLVGYHSNKDWVNTAAPYYDEGQNKNRAKLDDDGFNWTHAGARNKTATTATGAYLVTSFGEDWGVMSYVLGSTCYQVTLNADNSVKNVQYHSFMSTINASNNKISVAYGNFMSGASVRCVRDTAK